jgi:GDSL-like Lipase/Acylhydrolase family
MASALAVLILLGVGLISVLPSSGTHSKAARAAASGPARPSGHQPGHTMARLAQAGTAHGHPAHSAAAGSAHARTAAHARVNTHRTSCRAVAHIGDSTSVGLVSPDYLPNPAQRIKARYAAVGVRSTWADASGGRSIVETMPGQVNGYGVATNWDHQGFRGCWVIALGTNDTANVSVGSSLGRMGRIQEMMAAAHGQPVLWVNVKTLDPAGPWSESNMQLWNSTLQQACARYPNLRIFNWAGVAQDSWFISDGIHYTSAGYAARAQLIASALAKAFPQGGHSHGCVVS